MLTTRVVLGNHEAFPMLRVSSQLPACLDEAISLQRNVLCILKHCTYLTIVNLHVTDGHLQDWRLVQLVLQSSTCWNHCCQLCQVNVQLVAPALLTDIPRWPVARQCWKHWNVKVDLDGTTLTYDCCMWLAHVIQLRHGLFHVNQPQDFPKTVAYNLKKVVGFWNMFQNPAKITQVMTWASCMWQS